MGDGPSPLHYRAFRAALVSRAISGLGSWMQVVAAGWLVFDVTGSAAAVGILTVAARGPSLVLSLYGGTLADRFDRRMIVAVSSLVLALLAGLLALIAVGGVSSMIAIYLPVLAMGVVTSLANPAGTEIVLETVPPELARRATGMDSVGYNLARLAGPAVAGAIVVTGGTALCFAFNGFSYLIALALAFLLPTSATQETHQRMGMREAGRVAAADWRFRALLTVTLTFSVIVAPVQELAPAIAKEHGHGAHLLGFMLSAIAVGGLLGNLIRRRSEGRVNDRLLLGGALTGAAIALAALGLATAAANDTGWAGTLSYGGTLFVMLLLGIAWDILYVITLTEIQLHRREVSGVMTGLFYTMSLGGLSIGAVVIGLIFDVIEIDGGLLVCAAALLVAGAYFLRRGVGERQEAAPQAT